MKIKVHFDFAYLLVEIVESGWIVFYHHKNTFPVTLIFSIVKFVTGPQSFAVPWNVKSMQFRTLHANTTIKAIATEFYGASKGLSWI